MYRNITLSNSVSNAASFIGEITKHGQNLVSSALPQFQPNPITASSDNLPTRKKEMNLEAVKIQVTVGRFYLFAIDS